MTDQQAGGQPPSEEELRAQLEEEMKRIRVEDVLVQTTVTLVNLGGRKLGLMPEAAGERDLGQAKLAIDGARALVPLIPEEPAAQVRQALTQLQMAYAREARSAGEQAPPAGRQPPGEARRQEPAEDPERAKARSKIWTPPGA